MGCDYETGGGRREGGKLSFIPTKQGQGMENVLAMLNGGGGGGAKQVLM